MICPTAGGKIMVKRSSFVVIPLAFLVVWPMPRPASASPSAVTRIPVAFGVSNTNGSALPCRPDDLTYTIAGEIVGPSALLTQPRHDLVATLYLHELSFGKFFWTFGGVPGYDYTDALARAGHVSVVVDRLGYDASGRPPGNDTCFGAQADIASQIVRQLKSGTYAAPGGSVPLAFGRIVLAGHSVGGGIAELAAESFPQIGIDGLILFAWADRDFSQRTIEQGANEGADCAGGGQPADAGGPPNYAYFGRTEADFQQNVFADTDPRVVAAVTRLRNRDPCGDVATLVQLSAVNASGAGKITVPVLLLFGDADANFQAKAADDQAAAFTASPGVTVRHFAGAGHALTLELAAPAVRAAAASWLGMHGFVSGGARRPGTEGEPRAVLPATGPSMPARAPAGLVLAAAGVFLRRRARHSAVQLDRHVTPLRSSRPPA
jgi:pimeloyl-ACP methyl ester carboxylesterase